MSSWVAPLRFIRFEDEKLRLNKEAVEKLKKIEKPFSVVCIAGRQRSGKSYLMNRLIGQNNAGFPLGSTVEAVTKGIWIWYIDHPHDAEIGFVVMDTEGLDETDGENREEYEMWILSLSVLLSSTFIYNVIGIIGSSVIDRLSFVSELSKRIHYETENYRDADFDGFFPQFVLVVRDVTLELSIDNNEVTEDQYMELRMLHALKGAKKLKEKRGNETKLKLRKYFPTRKCFAFISPVEGANKRAEILTDKELPKLFVDKLKEFCSYIFRFSPTKKLTTTKEVNGEMFVQLTALYLDAINHKNVPCVKSAIKWVAQSENERAVKAGFEKYKFLMAHLVYPVEQSELEKAHMKNQEAAIIYFFRKSFLDENNKHCEELQVQIANEYLSQVEQNATISAEKCKKILEELYEPIKDNLKRRAYTTPEGYNNYITDLEILKEAYRDLPGKGTMANISLDEFLIKKSDDDQLILETLFSEKERLRESTSGSSGCNKFQIFHVFTAENRHSNEVEKLRKERELGNSKRHKDSANILAETLKEQAKLQEIVNQETVLLVKKTIENQLLKRQEEIQRLKAEDFQENAKELLNDSVPLKNMLETGGLSCLSSVLRRLEKLVSKTMDNFHNKTSMECEPKENYGRFIKVKLNSFPKQNALM